VATSVRNVYERASANGHNKSLDGFASYSMKHRLAKFLVWLMMLAVGITSIAAQPQSRKVHFGRWGYLVLPHDYKVYRTDDLRDAWFGDIAAPDNKAHIEWCYGMVGTPFDAGDDKFAWVKSENLGKSPLKYGLRHTNDGDIVAAALPGLNLAMLVKSENDIDAFLVIARSYRIEKCDDCEHPLPLAPSNKSLDASRDSLFLKLHS
jgi:hypothetical protein